MDKCAKWRPPEHLLEYLLELPPDQLALLFDPHAEYSLKVVDAVLYSSSEEDYIVSEREDEQEEQVSPEYSTPIPPENTVNTATVPPQVSKEPRMDPEAHRIAVEAFGVMLREREDLDPFQSWEMLKQHLSKDPRFQAIPTDRERKSIFDSICPELAERARKAREGQQAAAKATWKEILRTLMLANTPATWTEFSRRVKKEPWYRHLDPKAMEKEYRARLIELRDRSIVYQIPK